MPNVEIKHSTFDAEPFVQFYTRWEDEILMFHPDFEIESTDLSTVLTLSVDGMLIGVFIYEIKGDQIHVEVDFVITAYRNLGIGKEFFEKEIVKFKAKGYTSIVAFGSHEIYIRYLLENGFKQKFERSSYYELVL
ncbi:MAG: hypothetical protein ABJG68_02950 [Crocinitomicaceae bacterium]